MHNIVVQRIFSSKLDIEKGLMFDNNPFESPDVVALFVFDSPRLIGMWMRNTPRSLDMLFIRANNTVACIHTDTKPYDDHTINCGEPVLYVVEALAGYIARKNIKVGDKIMFSSYIHNSFTVT